ncbi:MAG: hypothetical protein Q7S46_12940 [Gallionella sp.]|nr:hypothetical protein [Gallionella sp.]
MANKETSWNAEIAFAREPKQEMRFEQRLAITLSRLAYKYFLCSSAQRKY